MKNGLKKSLRNSREIGNIMYLHFRFSIAKIHWCIILFIVQAMRRDLVCINKVLGKFLVANHPRSIFAQIKISLLWTLECLQLEAFPLQQMNRVIPCGILLNICVVHFLDAKIFV